MTSSGISNLTSSQAIQVGLKQFPGTHAGTTERIEVVANEHGRIEELRDYIIQSVNDDSMRQPVSPELPGKKAGDYPCLVQLQCMVFVL